MIMVPTGDDIGTLNNGFDRIDFCLEAVKLTINFLQEQGLGTNAPADSEGF